MFARDWWYARWQFQTIDGRKWGWPAGGVSPWPWPGASDTRIRAVEKVIGQHRTLGTFALRNMKIQAKSTRPGVTIRESQQATTLLNWMLFTHMQAELHRENRLALSWRNGYGSSIIRVAWKQTSRLDYIDLNVMALQEFINEPAVQAFVGTSSGGNGQMQVGQIPIGENLSLLDLQEMMMDRAYEDDLAVLLKAVSHDFLSLREAHQKLDELRQVRTVQIPIPYVFESRPQVTAYRPMVDFLYPAYADDLQRIPWHDCIEYVSETELRDRIDTAGYSSKFVESAVQHRGPTAGTDWRIATATERSMINAVGPSNMENDIELHHFYSLVHDRGTPIRFYTVFHMDVEEEAKHEPDHYKHGEACFHPLRFEIEDRPILSSRGIAEIAYTWERELKDQYDAHSDMTALTLRPPLITTYDQVLKLKESMQPGVVFPMRKFDEAQFMKLPTPDQRSIMIVQAVEMRIKEHFAIFGIADQILMKLRQEEFVDDILSEYKRPTQQLMKLCKQYLPDHQVAAVVGPLMRPFHVEREDIQGEFEISATVDLRNLDSDFLKEKLGFLAQLAQLDTLGILDKAALIRTGAEAIDYSLADVAVRDQQQATEAEVQDEQHAVDLIIGSGQDQPLPKSGNFQLRLQTLQGKQQSIAQNPATMKIIQGNPDIIKVLMNRALYFTRQLQQQQNAQIGRMQVGQTFGKPPQAPQVQANMPGAGLPGGNGAGGGGGMINLGLPS